MMDEWYIDVSRPEGKVYFLLHICKLPGAWRGARGVTVRYLETERVFCEHCMKEAPKSMIDVAMLHGNVVIPYASIVPKSKKT